MSEELARRAVACPGWRWLPGMRCLDGSRMLRAGRDLSGPWQAWSDEHCDACACKLRPEETRDDLPDLSDPATVGCLLALVREAWDWPNAFACHDEIGWYVPNGQTGCSVEWQIEASDGERHDTEAAALVAALEAAP